MEFYFAGGAMEIGGSCIYVRIAGVGVLMDAGIRQGKNKDELPDFYGIQQMGGVDLIMISHAHMDHTGSLPVISKAYPNARIYMTKMTLDETRVLLYDSIRLMERQEDGIPKYSENDVISMLERVIPLHFQEEILIPEYDMRLTAYPAGHIAGVACLYLKTKEGTILYTGDVSGFQQQTIEGTSIPRLRPDVTIMESTYGNRMHASRALEEERLVSMLAECVNKGWKTLIPVFALGRSQEVLLILRAAIQNGKIPPVPVYVDGMVRDMNRVYYLNPTYLRNSLARRILKGNDPFYSEEIRETERTADREALLEADGPAIFVTSSGMLSGGPSVTYAKKLLPREDACIILTGYQDEEAPGRLLMNLTEDSSEDKYVTLDGLYLPVRCRVEMVGLSAHADQSELCGIVERTSSRNIILVHGDQDAVNGLGNALSSDWRRNIYQPSVGDSIRIDIRSPREQLGTVFPYSMQLETGSKVPASDLWEAWKQYYTGRAFTIREIAEIVYGSGTELTNDTLQSLQEALLDSPYFSRHPKRLFLIRANTTEEAEEEQKKGTISQKDAEDRLRELLRENKDRSQALSEADSSERVLCEEEVRRISLYPEEKRAVINVDFPDAFSPDAASEISRKLIDETGWRVEIGRSMNYQKVTELLSRLFTGRVQKTSYYVEKKQYLVVLKVWEDTDPDACNEFRKTTGWEITCQYPSLELHSFQQKDAETGKPISEMTKANDWYLPEMPDDFVEQNLAFSIIDDIFSETNVTIYRRGIKSDSIGKYIEISFISPEIGRTCDGQLTDAAERTGWRVHISDSVNQNELFRIASDLGNKYGVTFAKNPSYLPGKRTLRIVTDPGVPVQMRQEFLEKTGIVIE